MKIIRRTAHYLLFFVLNFSVYSVTVLGHSNENEWPHHMPGMWDWGWPFMIIFWVIGILIIVLLVVTIIKVSKK